MGLVGCVVLWLKVSSWNERQRKKVERAEEGDYFLEEGVVDLLYGADFYRFHHPASRDDDAAESLGWGGHTEVSPAGGKKVVW